MFPRRPTLAALIACLSFAGSLAASAQIAPYLNFPNDESGDLPALLSETGAFSDIGTLSPSPGVQAYEVNQPLWSDGAEKFRWAGIPAGSKIEFAPKGKWLFPPGSVLVKHFELGTEGRRIETRFEIFKPGGGAYFLTYRWRSDQSDADLLSSSGFSETLTLADGTEQTWSYPSRIGCTACHNDASNPVLGPNTRQLNREIPGSGTNQLSAWNDLGLFNPAIETAAIASFDALARISDTSAPLELRARSYLDTNCAVCHNPGSSPPGAAFDARFDTPLAESGIPNGRVLVPLGIPGARVIKAQDPAASIMLHRISSNEESERMPPIGRSVVHEEARELLLRWLLTLDPITSLDLAGFRSRWNFEGTLEDETGNNDGSSSSSPANYQPGVNGQSIALLGGGDHVDLGSVNLSGDALTWSLWIWIDDLARTAPFLADSSGAGLAETAWSIGQTASGQLEFHLRTAGMTTNLTSPPGTLAAQQWTHIGAIYDGETMRLYRDGSEVASTTKSGEIDRLAGATATIGWQPGSPPSSSFQGRIDDLRIYLRALGASGLDTVRQAAINQNSAPTADIDEPGEPSFQLAGVPIQFSASADDPEDGDLSPNGRWYSSRDGHLGTGASLTTSKLSPGQHLIVFTANDDQRVAASDTQEVTIVPGLARYLKTYGLTGAATDPLADSDGDGLRQIQEYAFHLDPNRRQPTPVAASDGGIRFPLSKQAIDLEFTVQTSRDLKIWNDAATFLPTGNAVSLSDGTGIQQLSAIDLGATIEIVARSPDPTQRFHRLRLRTRL